LTKAYGLGSLRIGWIALGEGLVRERHVLDDMAALGWVYPPTVTLRAGTLAFAHMEALLEPVARVRSTNRPLWERWLEETEGVEAFVPEHGLIAFPRLSGIGDTLDFSEYLVREHEVDVVPGEFFGMAGHIRVGYGLAPEKLAPALERLARGIRAYRSL
jgi:aspartate/methionine/tyrosine aminotransferase